MASGRRRGWISMVLVIGAAAGVYLALRTIAGGGVLDADPRPARAPGAVDVVLVVVDTERVDRTSTYGYGSMTTPFLSAAARKGIRFTRAYSAGPWTVPSMYSLITSLYPDEHGITTGWHAGLDVGGQKVLPDEAVTLTERLDAAGYETFGVCTNFHVSQRFGFGQGFDHFVGEDFSFMPFPNLALEALRERILASERYFLWLHYLDPHYPYLMQFPWFEQYNDTRFHSYEELMLDSTLRYYYRERGVPEGEPLRQKDTIWVNRLARLLVFRPVTLVQYLRDNGLEPEPEWVRFLEAAYASEIRMVDEAMEQALAGLGVDENTLVVITSDHGEELYDHGGHGHRNNNSLYDELLHVPLVVLLPGREGAGSVVDTPVSLVDLGPTILDVLGMELPADVSGVSLLPLMRGGAIAERPLYAEVTSQGNVLRCMIEYPWKYIHDYAGRTGELYKLDEDPDELRDLSQAEPERTGDMRQRLLEHYEALAPRWIPGESPELKPEDVIKLKLLGYIE